MRRRYEICELVRSRAGANVVRVMATAGTLDDAETAARTIRRESGVGIAQIAIFDTATRLWLDRA